MSQDDYDLKPSEPSPPPPAPKPGQPGWIIPEPVIEKAPPADAEPEIDPDVQQHKAVAIAGYICFLIPLLVAPNSKFARFHANQGLLVQILLFVAVMAVVLLHLGVSLSGIVFKSIGILDWFFSSGFHLLQFALLVSWVVLLLYAIVQAANGLTKTLPGVGHWTLIK